VLINNILPVITLSLLAGMMTGLGGLIAIISKPGRRSFGFLIGIAAGVMITLSFLDLVNEAWTHGGFLTATIGFGLGAAFMFLIDFFTPHIRFGEREPDNLRLQSNADECSQGRLQRRHRRHRWWTETRTIDKQLFKTGVLVAIGIAVHNTPEGIAVGAGYMHAPQFGIFIALAIGLHNIPEGIATALPLFQSGASRWVAFRTALLSGLAEPIGALLAALFLASFKEFIPGALAFAGGVMVFITLDELIPCAREYGHQHSTALGIIIGAISIFLLSGLIGL
jgi:ZIP family zinc transporter